MRLEPPCNERLLPAHPLRAQVRRAVSVSIRTCGFGIGEFVKAGSRRVRDGTNVLIVTRGASRSVSPGILRRVLAIAESPYAVRRMAREDERSVVGHRPEGMVPKYLFGRGQ